MRHMTSIQHEQERIAFVERAVRSFEQHPDYATFGDLEPGSLLALRWGLGNDCVLVVRLDEDYEIAVYQQAIKKVPEEEHNDPHG